MGTPVRREGAFDNQIGANAVSHRMPFEWLVGLDSNYAALLNASTLRNQLVNRFQLAPV